MPPQKRESPRPDAAPLWPLIFMAGILLLSFQRLAHATTKLTHTRLRLFPLLRPKDYGCFIDAVNPRTIPNQVDNAASYVLEACAAALDALWCLSSRGLPGFPLPILDLSSALSILWSAVGKSARPTASTTATPAPLVPRTARSAGAPTRARNKAPRPTPVRHHRHVASAEAVGGGAICLTLTASFAPLSPAKRAAAAPAPMTRPASAAACPA